MIVFCVWAAHAQTAVQYHLTYPAAGGSVVQVRVDLPSSRPAPVILTMPRTYPGGYGLVLYDSFVENVRAFSDSGKPVAVRREPFGPRWILGSTGEQVAHVEYSVDVMQMENKLPSSINSSKIRSRYAGLLGYSVFALIDGLEDTKITLQVDGPADWPVFSTLAPVVPAPVHSTSASAPNYYALADSQVLMGPGLKLRRLDGAIALVMAVYAEGEVSLALEGELARKALDRVQHYFGDTPFRAYTVQLELLKPVAGHEYGFSQEHLNSGTFSLSAEEAITANSTVEQQEDALLNIAHHMAHSWIPKRAYSTGYQPVLWEMPPVIDTIWFNEGFGRYASIAALAEGMPADERDQFLHRELDYLQGILDKAPASIRRMPTVTLSREASFLYEQDFRTGRNIFARGALMAAEMDRRIRLESHGKASLRDALVAIILHTQKEQRPFAIDELAPVFQQATGVDVSDILQRWLQPQDH